MKTFDYQLRMSWEFTLDRQDFLRKRQRNLHLYARLQRMEIQRSLRR